MRLLFVIPHFFKPISSNATNRSKRPEARAERLRSLIATVTALHRTFGDAAYGLDHGRRIAWRAAPTHYIDIVLCTTGRAHLLDELSKLRPFFRHHATTADPRYLGFECHRVLADAQGRYDYYGYIEDDIILSDPMFFRKRALFDRRFGPEALLQPNRWERDSDGAIQKLYIDYRLKPSVTASYQNVQDRPQLEMTFIEDTIRFERTTYPSAGCFFLSSEQLPIWAESPAFKDNDMSYMSALDSAATLSIIKTFRIYKPILDQAWFLEVGHSSPRWISWATSEARLLSRNSFWEPISN